MMSVTKSVLVVFAVLFAAVGCENEPVVKSEVVTKPEPKPKEDPPLTGTPVVIMKTTKGTMKIELYPEKAPETVKNFLKYVDRKFYDSTVFHRVLRNAIQGGGYRWDIKANGLKTKRPREPIKNESDNGLKNERGTIAMARAEDPESATSQFFINLKNSRNYDSKGDKLGYCVFGKVIEGMDVADAIGAVETTKQVPTRPVFVRNIRREQ